MSAETSADNRSEVRVVNVGSYSEQRAAGYAEMPDKALSKLAKWHFRAASRAERGQSPDMALATRHQVLGFQAVIALDRRRRGIVYEPRNS